MSGTSPRFCNPCLEVLGSTSLPPLPITSFGLPSRPKIFLSACKCLRRRWWTRRQFLVSDMCSRFLKDQANSIFFFPWSPSSGLDFESDGGWCLAPLHLRGRYYNQRDQDVNAFRWRRLCLWSWLVRELGLECGEYGFDSPLGHPLCPMLTIIAGHHRLRFGNLYSGDHGHI